MLSVFCLGDLSHICPTKSKTRFPKLSNPTPHDSPATDSAHPLIASNSEDGSQDDDGTDRYDVAQADGSFHVR